MIIDNKHLDCNAILQSKTFTVALFDNKINENFLILMNDRIHLSFQYYTLANETLQNAREQDNRVSPILAP